MHEWILSIIGIVFVLLITDLIIPNGGCKKIIQSVVSIFFLCVFFTPISNFTSKNNVNEYQVDMDLYSSINSAKNESLKTRINQELSSRGINDINVDIFTDTANIDNNIKFVYVDLSNLSLSIESKHINTNEVIKSVVTSLCKIDEEHIIIYGQ